MSENYSVSNALALTNQKPSQRLLTEENFEVLNVKKISGRGLPYNTEVNIRVDLHASLPEDAKPMGERFIERTQRITRLDIKEALQLAGHELNELGAFTLSADEALTTLSLVEGEYNIRDTDNGSVIVIHKDSLGYTGHATVGSSAVVEQPEESGEGSEEGTPEPTPIV